VKLANLVVCCIALAGWARAGDTVLERYVAAPDSSYGYTLVRTLPFTGLTIYQIDLVSQTWLTAGDVDRTEWHHWMTIWKPAQAATSTALLIVDGGSNSSMPPSPDPTITVLAAQAGAVVIDLGQVPNEPLTFAG
jgi:PhoPQ-activated pathogenicity-related protein